MPLTEKGRKIKASMKKQYGDKKGEQVFYASQNKGTIEGTHMAGTYHKAGGKVYGEKVGGGGAPLSGDRGAEYRAKGRIHDMGKPRKQTQKKDMSTRHDA